MNTTQGDKLMADLRTLESDVDEMVKASAGKGDEGLLPARDRLSDSLRRVQDQLSKLRQDAAEGVKSAAKVSDEYVHEHAWQSVGVAAAVGLLLGFMVGRR